MVELASLNQTGAAEGDTFQGKIIPPGGIGADGQYVFVPKSIEHAFIADQEAMADFEDAIYRELGEYSFASISGTANAPANATPNPGKLIVERIESTNALDITLIDVFSGQTWKQGYPLPAGPYGGWTETLDRAYALPFAGTEVLGANAAAVVSVDTSISAFGDSIADLTTITDGPGGITGAGAVTSKEYPTGTGNYRREMIAFDTGAVYSNYWDGTAWGGWQGGPAILTQAQVEDGTDLTAGAVTGERIKQAIDKHRPIQLDAGAPWDTATDYVGAGNEQFTLTMPATVANGPFITANGQTLEAGQSYIMIYAADRTAADSVAAIGDDAATATEVTLMNLVGVASVSRAEVDVLSSGLSDEITTRTTDDAALTARLDALPPPFSGDYNDLTNQPAVPQVSTDVDFTNDPALVADRATIKTALDSLNLGKWLPEVADITARDALTGVVENDKVRVTDAGSGLWVNYQSTKDNPVAGDWQIISEEGAQVPPLSEADAIAGTATTDSAISASTLSATIAARLYYDIRETYGLNQRVYDAASGNYYQSLQANNLNHPLNDAAWWEADLAATTDYIRNLGPVATLTDVDLAAKFPVGDESRPLDIITVGDVAYQMKIGTSNPQVASSWEPVSIPGTLFLNEITIPIRSAGTNAGSNVTVTFYDRNGDVYSPTNFLLNGNLTQYTGGTAEINFVDSPFNGLIGIGRNKTGAVSFSWNSDVSLMNGLSRVDVVGNSGGSVNGQVAGSFIGVSDAFLHPANAPIVPPEEFTSQKQTAYDDNPDLTVNTGVGMTRQGLQSLFGGVDAAAAWDTDADYTGTDNKPFSLQPPPALINGPYVTSDNVVLEAGKTYNLKYQLDRTAVDSVAAFADDAASVAEVALMEYIGVTGTGKADKTLDLNPRFLGGAFKAVITSIPPSLLQDGIAFSDKDELWVYHAGLSPADVAGFTTLEPDTKANPGVDNGFWVRQGGGGGSAKNALEYPAGNFTALPVNDSTEGADGAVYSLPSVDALQITLPNKADMDLANGIWRVRVNADWAVLAAQTTPLSFTDDTANGVDFGIGLPDSGREWVDLILDLAGDRWLAVSGGDVVLSQVLPSYDEHAEVPTAVRLYLATGVGAAAEGLYRKQVSDNSAQLIG